MKRTLLRLKQFVRDESGQAVTEYAVLFTWSIVILIATLTALRMAVFDYYQDVASLICLPIP